MNRTSYRRYNTIMSFIREYFTRTAAQEGYSVQGTSMFLDFENNIRSTHVQPKSRNTEEYELLLSSYQEVVDSLKNENVRQAKEIESLKQQRRDTDISFADTLREQAKRIRELEKEIEKYNEEKWDDY